MSRGIVAYGVYLPYWRLVRARIAEALDLPATRGTRSVASYDEDATTMAVEAGLAALRAASGGTAPAELVVATTAPAYLDKTNAVTVHAALGLDRGSPAFDMNGAVRSGSAALRYAARAERPALAILSDCRNGLPGGAEERDGGDGAAAFLFAGGADVVAEQVAYAATTAEFLDRWRLPGEGASHLWEERFGESEYLPLAEEAITDALKQAGVTTTDVDHLVVTGSHARAVRAVQRGTGFRPAAVADDLTDAIGNAGAAHQGIALAGVLDTAAPGALVAAVTLADGAEATVFRVTNAIVGYRKRQHSSDAVSAQIAAGRTDLSYCRFLTWRDQLRREPPRRPEPSPPSAPPAARNQSWKFRFAACRCGVCGTRLVPPGRVCIACGATDRMIEESLAGVPGAVATFTVDRLAFTPNPPMVVAVIDFEGGGRFRCELTDVDPETVAIGDRVEMTFRKVSTTQGIHNYFWKARPARGGV